MQRGALRGHDLAAGIRIQRAVFRFIPDPAAQVAALLAGDVDLRQQYLAAGLARSTVNRFVEKNGLATC